MNKLDKVKKLIHKRMVKSLKKEGNHDLAKKLIADGIDGIDKLFERYREIILTAVKNRHKDAVVCEIADSIGTRVLILRCKFAQNLPIYCIAEYSPTQHRVRMIDCERYTYYKDKHIAWVKVNSEKYCYLSDDMETVIKFEFATPLMGDVAIVKNEDGYSVMTYDFRRIADIVEIKEVETKTKFGNSNGIQRIAITKNGQEFPF